MFNDFLIYRVVESCCSSFLEGYISSKVTKLIKFLDLFPSFNFVISLREFSLLTKLRALSCQPYSIHPSSPYPLVSEQHGLPMGLMVSREGSPQLVSDEWELAHLRIVVTSMEKCFDDFTREIKVALVAIGCNIPPSNDQPPPRDNDLPLCQTMIYDDASPPIHPNLQNPALIQPT